jgi:hypothetical protein
MQNALDMCSGIEQFGLEYTGIKNIGHSVLVGVFI